MEVGAHNHPAPAPAPAPAPSATKRACDGCHKRKVKCDGQRPCRNCQQSSLICTFDAIPQKKGPKGHRAKIISRLREQQQRNQLSSHLQRGLDRVEATSSSSSSSVAAWAPTPGLLTTDVVEACIAFFFENMYPTMPILDRGRLQRQRQDMESSLETYCLIASLCAFMLIQPGMKITTIGDADEDLARDGTASGQAMVDEVLRVRKAVNYVESPTVASVITSFFLFGSYFCLDKHNTAWFYMREATTLTDILGMGDESTYHTGDEIGNIRRRRLYWLLFVTERAYALQRHHPLTLGDTIALPTLDEIPGESVEVSGFIYLVNVYRPFDEKFVGLWNKTRLDCSTEWLAQLQRRLAVALPTSLVCTESQAADLRTSQQWLRAMVWQLSITNGYLSSSSSSEASMTFRYPIDIARDLVGMTSQMSKQSMEMHGIGLIGKLFDLASTLTDVMACVPLETPSFELGPRDYLNQFLSLISSLRGGQARYVPLLLNKIENMLSTMAGPLLPPLIFETPNDGIEEVGDITSSSHFSLLQPPPTLSASSSDTSDFSFVGSDEPQTMNAALFNGSLAPMPPPPPPLSSSSRHRDHLTAICQVRPANPEPPHPPKYDNLDQVPMSSGWELLQPKMEGFQSGFG